VELTVCALLDTKFGFSSEFPDAAPSVLWMKPLRSIETEKRPQHLSCGFSSWGCDVIAFKPPPESCHVPICSAYHVDCVLLGLERFLIAVTRMEASVGTLLSVIEPRLP
jgi:hypothetical protein